MVSAAHLLIRNEVENIRECFWEATTGITRDHTNKKEPIKSIHKLPTNQNCQALVPVLVQVHVPTDPQGEKVSNIQPLYVIIITSRWAHNFCESS